MLSQKLTGPPQPSTRQCAVNASTNPTRDARPGAGTNRATFRAFTAKWESSCNAAVALSHPFDRTMASNTCQYCSQLVVPSNLGTFVDVYVSCHLNPAAGGPPYPPTRSPGTSCTVPLSRHPPLRALGTITHSFQVLTSGWPSPGSLISTLFPASLFLPSNPRHFPSVFNNPGYGHQIVTGTGITPITHNNI